MDVESAALVNSTFTVVNLHCSSCVANIEDAVHALGSDLRVSHSIVNHTVTVSHPPQITDAKLAHTLEEAGFELYDVDTADQPPTDQSLEDAIYHWAFPSGPSASRKRKRHIESCEFCRSHAQSRPPESLKEASSDAQPQTFRATLSIAGMTCSACVNSITQALKTHDSVKSCNVDLISNAAVVEFDESTTGEKLASIIEDAGFEATVQDVHPQGQPDTASAPSIWKATLAIGGMTCASCVSSVRSALEAPEWSRSVNVNLLENSAEVLFENEDNASRLTGLVEEVGFDAKLDSLLAVGAPAKASQTRAVIIQVEGMFCNECPKFVLEAVHKMGGIRVKKPLSFDDPRLEIEYTPVPPSQTIRQILQGISAAHPSFRPSIYHPMTLEERSTRMRAQEHRRILVRFILSACMAIPSFVVGMVYMTMVNPGDATRDTLMRPVRGIRIADWVLLALSTPIYFGAADMFHRRAFKEIRALWRPGSPTPLLKRFYRFGSMNMLVSFGTSIAYWSSIAELALITAHPTEGDAFLASSPFYFDSVVFLTLFLLLGRLIEAHSKAKTGDAVAALGKLRPSTAILITDPSAPGTAQAESTRHVSVDLVEAGDTLRVVHGSSPPCDGTLLSESATFDEASLTGESKPVVKSTGDQVFTGTINKSSAITTRATEKPGASMLDQIISVVREGQAKRAPIERLADSLTAYFVPFITLVAICTWIIWLCLALTGALPASYLDVPHGGWPFWSLQFAIAVFVVACPCGLGLAAPTALFVGGGLAAKQGILVRGGGEAFQEASRVDVVAFDKTGTLTQGGTLQIVDSKFFPVADRLQDDAVHAIVCKLEEDSSHPVASALVSFTREPGSPTLLTPVSTKEIPGRGMQGTFGFASGQKVEALVGNELLLADFQVAIRPDQAALLNTWKRQGWSVALLAVRFLESSERVEDTHDLYQWRVTALFAAADPLRPEAAAVVRELQAQGVDVWMISGDNEITASSVGQQLGIPGSNIIAGVLPTAKAEQVKFLQSQATHRRRSLPQRLRLSLSRTFRATREQDNATNRAPRAIVAFVGDGINDAPALAAADVSVAIGTGADVALASASFVLLAADLRALPALVALSKAVFNRVRANFAWAIVYNAAALPVAAGVLYPLRIAPGGSHVRLDPAWAALAMALSSVSVVLSSLALRTRIPVLGFRSKRWSEAADVQTKASEGGIASEETTPLLPKQTARQYGSLV